MMMAKRSLPASSMAALITLLLLTPVLSVAQGRPFRLQGLKGGELQPADLDQGVVIAVVWASWSPRCRDIVPRVNAIADRWGSQARVISVNFQEDRSEAESFLGNQQSKAKVYLDEDGTFSKRYSVTNLPGLVIFKDGKTAFSGKLSNNPDSLIAQTIG